MQATPPAEVIQVEEKQQEPRRPFVDYDPIAEDMEYWRNKCRRDNRNVWTGD